MGKPHLRFCQIWNMSCGFPRPGPALKQREVNLGILIYSRLSLTFSLSDALKFHQLERHWEHLRVRHAARQRDLLARSPVWPANADRAKDQLERYVGDR